MGMTNKVRLNICGSEYTFTTDEPEGYIQELGAQLDAEMRNLMNSDDHPGDGGGDDRAGQGGRGQ